MPECSETECRLTIYAVEKYLLQPSNFLDLHDEDKTN